MVQTLNKFYQIIQVLITEQGDGCSVPGLRTTSLKELQC